MKCPKCGTEAGLYKEIFDDGLMIIHCSLCQQWKTGKLDHHKYKDFLKEVPTIEEHHKKIEDWK